MLAGSRDFLRVFPHLYRIIRILCEQSGKAQDGIHGRPDIVGHVGEEGGLGIACHLRGLQCFRQLQVVQLSFRLPFFPDPYLLSVVEIIENAAEKKGDDRDEDNDQDILIYGSSLLLDGVNWHISD